MTTANDLSALRIERHEKHLTPARSWSRRTWAFLIGGALFLGFGASAFMGQPEVRVKPAVRASLAEGGAWGELNATGYIVADRQSTVAAKYTSRLAKLHVREAAEVKEGQVLAELDHRELDAMIAETEAEARRAESVALQAEAAIANAEAQAAQAKQLLAQAELEIPAAEASVRAASALVDEAEASVNDAIRRQAIDGKLVQAKLIELNRADDRLTEVKLVQARLTAARQRKAESEKSVPVAKARASAARSGVDAAEAMIRSARAAHEAAKAAHASAQARVKTLQTQREDYFVRSPFDGVVSERIAEQGEMVAPLSIGGTQAKGAIVTVVDRASLQAELDVAEGFLEKIKPAGRVRLTVDAFPKEVFPGAVQRILPMVDRGKATVKVRVDFAKIDPRFLPDMGIRGKFLGPDAPAGTEAGLTQDPLLVPTSAIITRAGIPIVWTVANDRAGPVPVKTGATRGDRIEILDGLSDGAMVVVQGATALSGENSPVKVLRDDPAAR